MSLRVTQRTMYNQFINQMQGNLSAYMESNIQGSSQKKINRPSDDPAGMALVLNYRNTIGNTEQLQRNVDTAKGWLNLADSTLTQVSATITEIKSLAEQAATGTMSPENRYQVGIQLRELFGQLVSLSNTEFEGKSIFAGHKYNNNAYETALYASTEDPNFVDANGKPDVFTVSGKSESTIMLRFTGKDDATGEYTYEWNDKWPSDGENWHTGTVSPSADPADKSISIDVNGVTLTIPDHTKISINNEDEEAGSHNNTSFYIRPAAYYQGDDNDPPPTVEASPPVSGNAVPNGSFSGKTLIRLTDTTDPSNAEYTYSTDNGSTWVKAKTDLTAEKVRFMVPGGYLEVDNTNFDPVTPTAADMDKGQQFVIRPHEADLKYEIMSGSYVSVTSVGKDIFGGLYQGMYDTTAQPAFGGDARNLFEIVGELIGWCETNNQEGVQKCFGELEEAQKTILTAAASVGGRENRLTLAKDVLSFQKLDQQERLSYTEDVDLTELLTRMAQQELAYNTVLKSSSMIMQLNLTKFV